MVVHLPIGRGAPVNNSPGRMAIAAALIEEQKATVAELAVAMLTAAMQGTEVEPQIAAEARVESGHQVEIELARAIDLAAREIAAAEIELAVATWEAVLGIEAASEMVAGTAAAVRVQAAIEVLPAWAVRVGGALAERAVEVAAVVAVAVAAVVGGGS